ncbi:hypothetical protein TrLO_g13082 [Triparma laevis f. longispina]|uniref:Peroxin-13 n=1 Tax=Triparma laevis f. longispina TaxID=1714387 RepID=A0A9W7FLL7_9STRA|nr:hypothetical protein TrLO_g13082 [Triparma laevis f. longispina]
MSPPSPTNPNTPPPVSTELSNSISNSQQSTAPPTTALTSGPMGMGMDGIGGQGMMGGYDGSMGGYGGGMGGYGGGYGSSYGGMGGMGGMMGGMGMGMGYGLQSMFLSSPPVQTLYLLNQLTVSLSMMMEMAVGNYRQWVMLRERIEGLTEGEPSEDEGIHDKILRFIFKGNTNKDKKRRKVIWFVLSILTAMLGGWTGKKLIDAIVEGKVKERIGGMESSFAAKKKSQK